MSCQKHWETQGWRCHSSVKNNQVKAMNLARHMTKWHEILIYQKVNTPIIQ